MEIFSKFNTRLLVKLAQLIQFCKFVLTTVMNFATNSTQ